MTLLPFLVCQEDLQNLESRMAPKLDSDMFAIFLKRFAKENHRRSQRHHQERKKLCLYLYLELCVFLMRIRANLGSTKGDLDSTKGDLGSTKEQVQMKKYHLGSNRTASQSSCSTQIGLQDMKIHIPGSKISKNTSEQQKNTKNHSLGIKTFPLFPKMLLFGVARWGNMI